MSEIIKKSWIVSAGGATHSEELPGRARRRGGGKFSLISPVTANSRVDNSHLSI